MKDNSGAVLGSIMSAAYVPQVLSHPNWHTPVELSIGLTPVEFMYRNEKSHVLLDSLHSDCWKPMVEIEMRERARTCEMRLLFERCGRKEQKLLLVKQIYQT